MQPDPLFFARIERALDYRAAGDTARFLMYCVGLRALYRRQRKSLLIEEGHHSVVFQLWNSRTGVIFARHLHRDPVAVKLRLPGRPRGTR